MYKRCLYSWVGGLDLLNIDFFICFNCKNCGLWKSKNRHLVDDWFFRHCLIFIWYHTISKFVNVTFPADWNAEDEAVYERIRQVAIRKYKERIDIGDIDFDMEPYEDHDPTDKSEV